MAAAVPTTHSIAWLDGNLNVRIRTNRSWGPTRGLPTRWALHENGTPPTPPPTPHPADPAQPPTPPRPHSRTPVAHRLSRKRFRFPDLLPEFRKRIEQGEADAGRGAAGAGPMAPRCGHGA